MPDYKTMYLKLVRAHRDAVLIAADQEAEEIALRSKDAIELLHTAFPPAEPEGEEKTVTNVRNKPIKRG